MYLKRVEIQGFKSFANKIKLEFHEGITGIVGPNGSGKSNVADAVRWVLGEQSAKTLRGGNMQDVIFAGTKLRKPQGYAYVAICLDNKDRALNFDYDEITISRRLFRSGESEYKINSSLVRLKDISELLYDTGIGKDGYSIIGQGQVEKILNGKPEERRELLDEAVGINKFKRRKSIAIKKLDSEKASLTRIADILSELEKQVIPLKEQSDKAKKYLIFRDELKILEANMFILQDRNISKELKEINDKLDILNADLDFENKKSSKINADFESLDFDIKKLDEFIVSIRDNLSKKQLEVKEAGGKIEVLNEQINTDKLSLEHRQNLRKSIERDISSRKDQITTFKADIKEISIELDDKNKSKLVLDNNILKIDEELKKLNDKLQIYNKSKLENLSKESDLKVSLEREKSISEHLNVRNSELDNRLISYTTKNKDSVLQLEEEKLSLDILNKDILNKESIIREKEKSLDEKKEALSALSSSISNYRMSYEHKRVNFESLKSISERYDGYGISIKKIMEIKREIGGINGVVADLIKLDKKYELAIETSLGGKIQNIVTDTEETAKVLIEYLKKNKFGRASFLPISSIKSVSTFKNKDILKEKGVIDIASNLVIYDDVYKNIIESLLSRVIIVDTLDNGIKLARKYNYEYRIVSLEGDQLLAGGSMSGGAYKNTTNLLSRKREIEELEKDLKKLNIQIQKFEEEEVNEKEKFNILKKDLEILKEDLIGMRLDYNTKKNTYEILLSNHSKIYEDIDIIKKEKENILKDLENSNVKILDLEKSLESIRTNFNDDEKFNLDLLLEEKLKFKDKVYSELRDLEQIIASMKSDIEYSEKNILRIEDELKDLESKKNNLENSNEFITIKEKESLIANINLNIDSLEKDILDLEKSLRESIDKKDITSGLHKDLFVKKDESLHRIALLEKDIFRLENSKEKFLEKLANLSNYMSLEYELNLEDSKKLKFEEEKSFSELKKDIDKNKSDIKTLGNININSIEEYNAVSTRYEEMRVQYDDIILASKELEKVIQDLDSGMRRQFKEKFAIINEEFNKVFSELFGGGSGKLELETGVDMLEANIQIISEPPGKKLQNMMQLSGGEKALTAISLLFAIQSLKPSPFALLDEIEAALDDSNVDRFANYLHKLSDKTQFIVITHRRGTMVKSDRLYGITMQEKGVSTLVSVNLIENGLK